MNKTELVAAIAEKTNLTKKDSEAALVAVVESITEALAKGDKVQVTVSPVDEEGENVAFACLDKAHKL